MWPHIHQQSSLGPSHLDLRVPMAARAKAAWPFETRAHSVNDEMTVLKCFRYSEREMFRKCFTEFEKELNQHVDPINN